MKNILIAAAVIFALMLQSCSVDMQTKYFRDSASGLTMDMKMDPSLLGMFRNMGADTAAKNKVDELKNLSNKWKSLYQLALENGKKLDEKSDSVKVMKKMFMKFNKENNEVSGLSFKYDHLLPQELEFSKNKKLRQQIGAWDGRQLTLDMQNLSPEHLMDIAKKDKPSSKNDSLQMAGNKMLEGMMDMLKLFDVKYKNRISFENKIKSISGKHDFLKQVGDKTIELSYRLQDFTDPKKLKNVDKKIIITTE